MDINAIFLLVMAFIYKITNTESGKCYIGETKCKDPQERWRRHKEAIRRGAGCPALRDAVNKYGIDKFVFEVIRECSLEERFDLERQLIKEYNTQAPNGYNILPGGEGGGFLGKRHKPESIAKIIGTQKQFREQNPDYFETYREKHRAAMEKVDLSACTKNSEVFQKAKAEGRVGAAGWKTTKTPEEKDIIKRKISNSLKKYFSEKHDGIIAINIENHRIAMAKVHGIKINQYDLNGNYLATFDSLSDARRHLNKTSHTNIQTALKDFKKTAYGFKWRKHEPKE